MPHTQRNFFGDLGRATRRGVRKCPKCGTVTGTRGKSCKNPSCDVVYRDSGCGGSKKSSDAESCRVSINVPNCRAFSVRIRERGPDYRSFVQLPLNQPSISSSQSSLTPKSISFGSRCYVDACSRNKAFLCNHIKSAEKCSRESERILIKHSVLSTISIPTEAKQIISSLVNQLPDMLVQRCSKASFIVKCNVTSRQPLGYLHLLFFKLSTEDGNSEQKFLCSCQPIKLLRRHQSNVEVGSRAFNSSHKFCLHYYTCISAFASNEFLATEFEFFLSRAFETYPQVNLVLLHARKRENPDEEEELEHPNQISVEIMRENLSLLESIASVDDPSAEVQGAEGVLSDQIVVTSVDDNLSFGDSSTLDSLDETDPNCTTHLTHISEILNQSNSNQQVVCQIFTSHEIQLANQLVNSSTEPGKECENLVGEYIVPTSLDLTKSSPLQRRKSSKVKTRRNRKTPLEKRSLPEEPRFHNITLESIIDESLNFERRIILTNFERWLAGVNERMNAAMNYQFQQPCLLVDYVPHEIFDCLKDRIISGYKKKRLSSQTVVVRKDQPPLGSFTKHIWKIVNIIHLIHIFQSSQVPLKLSQFFVQTSSGIYCEWTPSKPEDTTINKNTHIIPVLHCATIKVGKLKSNEKELTPFVIEWIPDILPESRMGEISFRFGVTRRGPIHTEEERKACNAPIQRLIQHSQTFSLT